MTLDFTYNPDFAQVEADATVVTANQRFPIFFEEKRPFFLEGKEIFETLISAVHTRTIVDPDYALKFTGKRGRNTFGVMLASDNAPGNLGEDDRDFIRATEDLSTVTDPALRAELDSRRNSILKVLDKNALVGVLRLKRDIGKEGHIGFLGTTSNFVDKYNHVAGFDTRYRFNKTDGLLGAGSGQRLAPPVLLRRGGWDVRPQGAGARLRLQHRFERAQLGLELLGRRPLALLPRRRGLQPPLQHQQPEPLRPLPVEREAEGAHRELARLQRGEHELRLGGAPSGLPQRDAVPVQDAEADLHRHRLSGGLRARLRVGVRLDARRAGPRRRQHLRPRAGLDRPGLRPDGRARAGHRGRPGDRRRTRRNGSRRCTFFGSDPERSSPHRDVYFYVESTPSKKYSFSVFSIYRHGALDFDFGNENPDFPRVSPAALAFGQGAPLDPGPGNELTIEASANYQPTDALRLSLSYNKQRLTRHDTGLVAFDDNIYTLRGTYQFTRFWFARARVDYTTLGRASARAVPSGLDAESGDDLLRRLQRRHEPQRPQPVLGSARARLPPQRPPLLHQDVLPLPPQLRRVKAGNSQKQ